MPAQRVSLPSAATSAPPKPRPATTTVPAYGQSARPSVAPAAAARLSQVPAAPDPDEMGWFAGIRDIPVGPITRAEMVKYIESGEATSETLVWRDGFADWRPLRLVPAFKELTASVRAQGQGAAMPSFHETEGDATTVTSGASLMAAVMATPARVEPPMEAPTRRLSALTDENLRAIRLPPPTGEKPAARAPTLAPTARPSTTTPTPGPAPLARTAPPLAAPKPAPAPSPLQKPLGPPLRTPTVSSPAVGARPPAPMPGPAAPVRSSMPPATPPLARKLDPVGPRVPDASTAVTPPRATPSALGSTPVAKPSPLTTPPVARPATLSTPPAPPPARTSVPAPPLASPTVSTPAPLALATPEHLTPVPSLDALSAAPEVAAPSLQAPPAEVFPPPPAPEPPAPPALEAKAPTLHEVTDGTPEPKETVKVGGSEWDDPLFHVSVAPTSATASSTPAIRSADAPKAGWADPVFNSLPPGAPSAAMAMPAATPSIPPHGVTTAQIPVTVDVARTKPRGVPKAAFVLALGVAVVGIAGGIALSRPKPPPPTPRAAAHAPVEPAPTPAPTPTPEQVVAPTPTPAVAPAPPDMAFPTPASDESNGHRPRSDHGSSRRQAAPAETQSETQRRLEAALGIRGGSLPSQPAISPTLPQPRIVAAPNAPSNSAAANTPPPSAARSLARTNEVGEAIQRSGVVRRCWEQFKLRNPAAPRRSLSIGWSISDTGSVTLRVSDRSEPILANCIERGSRDVRNLGAGPAGSDSTRVDLD
jgi:hypothetical protein